MGEYIQFIDLTSSQDAELKDLYTSYNATSDATKETFNQDNQISELALHALNETKIEALQSLKVHKEK